MPHAAARTGVPVGAAMSMPSWFRPPRGPNGDVTGAVHGLEIVEEPQPAVGSASRVPVWSSGRRVAGRSRPPSPCPLDPSDRAGQPVPLWTASWVPTCSHGLLDLLRAPAAGMFEPPIDAPLAVWPSKSEPQVARPTIPSTWSPDACW